MINKQPQNYSTKDLISNFWKRLLLFPAKLIGWNGAILTLATWALFKLEKFNGWMYIVVIIIVLFGLKGLEVIKDILQLKNK